MAPRTEPGIEQQTSGANEGVITAILDYAEGWYTGDVERMTRCLHPDLVKRVPTGDSSLELSTAQNMIDGTEDRHMPKYLDSHDLGFDSTSVRVEIDDVRSGIASARCYSLHYVDYIQLVDTDDGWKLVNVLYQDIGGPESERYRAWVTATESGGEDDARG